MSEGSRARQRSSYDQVKAIENDLKLAQASLLRCERSIRRGEAYVSAERDLAVRIRANIARLKEKQAELNVASPLKNDERNEHELERGDALERIARLSRREREVLNGLVAGKPNKVIAFDLNISPRTVEIYRANIMQKVQVASLPKLVRLTLLATESV